LERYWNQNFTENKRSKDTLEKNFRSRLREKCRPAAVVLVLFSGTAD
jgi:hypothetical protein